MNYERNIDEIKLFENYSQYLTFLLGYELYGFEVSGIREVIEYNQIKSITHIPLAPKYIKGVINLRGEVMPVIDLSYRFYGTVSGITRRTCVAIIELLDDEIVHIGAMIDAVNAVINISPDNIEPALGFSAKIRPNFIHGIGKMGDDFIILLDLQQTMNIEELSNFDNQVDIKSKIISNNKPII